VDAFWNKKIIKISSMLAKWEVTKTYPDWTVRQLIVNQTVIAATQFHAAAMFIPKRAKEQIQKLCNTFL
jgi:hypothetical protein